MIGNMDYTIELLKKHGWVEYEGGTWIKKEWIENRQPYDRMAVDIQTAIDLTLPKNMEKKNEESNWVSTDGRTIEQVTEQMVNVKKALENAPDLTKINELTENVIKEIKKNAPTNQDFDDSDIALIRILKNKLVRKQLYDIAAQLRDVEKSILIIIDDQDRKRKDGQLAEYKESLAFGDYLLQNFTACHWFENKIIDTMMGELATAENVKIFGYVKNDDPAGKTYSTEDVFNLFVLQRMKDNLTSKDSTV